MLRFILLSILFTIIFRKIGSLFLYLRRIFGGEKQNEIRRSDSNISKDAETRKRKKIFKESEGEYVDFEEVN
jgi:hypothetical protein